MPKKKETPPVPAFRPRAEVALPPMDPFKDDLPHASTERSRLVCDPVTLRDLIWHPLTSYSENPDDLMPGPDALHNLTYLTRNLIIPLRDSRLNVQFRMVWVPASIAPQLGLTKDSDHVQGCAADITSLEMSPRALMDAMDRHTNIQYNAMLIEGGSHLHVRIGRYLAPDRHRVS